MKTLIRNLIIGISVLGSSMALADEPQQKLCNGVKKAEFATYLQNDAKNYEFLANNTLVKDKRTGLTWQRCPLGTTLNDKGNADTKDDICKGTVFPYPGDPTDPCKDGSPSASQCVGKLFKTWSNAQASVKAIGDGWRLPNAKELASIAMPNCFIKKNNYVFPGNAQFTFISSTPAIKDGKYTHFKVVSFFQQMGELLIDVKADALYNPNRGQFGQGVMLIKD